MNEHNFKVTQLTETIDKQTVLVKSTNFGNPKSDKLGHVRIKRGREQSEEFEIIDSNDINAKVEFVNDMNWIADKMKNELISLIQQMGETAKPVKTNATLIRTKINQD
ncbi:hypothetical protein E3U55_04330 [Filobacillus milosensis]|uniref:Uncharacterized protein n=1 Tax=Filobacillus milosensis TaxID=94137 RepID=A0A4Y8IXE1_9BACI|nr:hypothetical protein [Filobacillus milosensis]TFB24045.1 hypothetical protein E3U55_04330 [Filobacillus milosensis]